MASNHLNPDVGTAPSRKKIEVDEVLAMQFYERHNLVLLWLVPLVILLFYFGNRRKRDIAKFFADSRTWAKVVFDHSEKKLRVRRLLTIVALFFVVFALARPQWGEEVKTLKRKGVDIVFMVDTSLSMLVEDLKPNRMELAKREIKHFVEKLKGDRIGLVAFAGSGFLQTPLTLDYAAFHLFLDALEVGLIPDPGTVFPEAVKLSIDAFQDTEKEYRVLVILSDGENHEGAADELLGMLKDAHVRVYAIGTATEKGGPIPLKSEGAQLTAYKKDREGETVVSRLDSQLLKTLAEGTGGLYYPATASGREVELIVDDMASIGKKELSERRLTQREDHFQSFLLIALVLLLFEMLLGERKGAWL